MSPSAAGGPVSRMRFGAFIAPYHPVIGNPTVQLRRDLDLAVLLDRLCYDEVWFGEHHSTGFEISASPELMIAAAGERTTRIMMGTGVSSLPFHQPLILADRINELDHLTRGRVIMGVGPGQAPSDAYMAGIDPFEQRRQMNESIAALVPLLRGEAVTLETDWFTLRDARLQLGPFTPSGIEIATASVYSPNGVTVAGEHGLSVLSLAAGDQQGREMLVDNWRIYEETCVEHGYLPRRENWRLVVSMHLAESAEQARHEVRDGVLRLKRLWADLGGREDVGAWKDPDEAVAFWLANGLPAFGKPVLGTPDDAITAIRELQELTGGFGVLLLANHGFASWADTQASYELFAEFVAPCFQGSLANRFASLEWMTDNKERFVGERKDAIAAANAKREQGVTR